MNQWCNEDQAGARFTNDFFCPQFKFNGNSCCCNSFAGHKIATNFCKWHDSCAVLSCTTFCSNHCIRIEVRMKRNFHRIWIVMVKLLVKQALVHIIFVFSASWDYINTQRNVETKFYELTRGMGKKLFHIRFAFSNKDNLLECFTLNT